MDRTIFRGSCVALVTPFNKGKVDFESLDRLLQYQLDNGTDAIAVCGTTGESCTLADDEHLSVIDYTVKKSGGSSSRYCGNGQ